MNIQYEKELNQQQLEAVKTIDGPILIIAGAGSGKTRTITFRIAGMLEKGIPQKSILGLTFTNKAAREMGLRIRKLTGKKLANLTITTFHSFGAKVLRETIHHLNYKHNFSIYDQADKISLIKEAARESGMSIESLDAYSTASLFSDIKTGRKTLSGESGALRKLYEDYQDHLHTYNAVDFDDLIVLPFRLFREHSDVLQVYQERFAYFMVDEFQDTSSCQYGVIRLLAEKSKNLCVVGDDDQSIYSWRGADYRNILQFEKDFPGVKEIKLEQNYRSTRTILSAANNLIAHNKERKEKSLWTGLSEGNVIEIFYPDNEDEEGIFIADTIKTIRMQSKTPFHDFGVLVRTNSLTRCIEAAFLAENIPYKVSGGTSFFQRKEVKDIISYLRLITNHDDDVNFLRICNTPRRGIGKKTLQTIRTYGEQKGYSLYSSLTALVHGADSPFSPKQQEDLMEFFSLIESYEETFSSRKKMADTLRSLIDRLNFWAYLVQENPSSDKTVKYKYANIMHFCDFLENFENDPDADDISLYGFLNTITLITRDDNSDDDQDGKVNLMTIHAAKGLEFKTVFLAGVESHLLPHARTLEDSGGNIEEERRLFYVAITRAREKLFLTSCTSRKYLRETIECLPSPFLEELPRELIQNHETQEPVEEDEARNYFDAIKSKFV